MKYILAFDQGTTSSRSIVFDLHGQIISVEQQEFEQIFPKPGWVEHDAEEIWASQLATAKAALNKADTTANDIAAIGITNQRETTVVWDRQSGDPIHNAIVWQDRRTAAYCDDLKSRGLAEKFRSKTGLVLDAYFSGTKVRWILENVDGARKRAENGELAFGTIDSWLIWKLTGGKKHVTDVTNASRTLLYNIHDLEWDEEILEELSIPASMLPTVKSSSEIYGNAESSLLGEEIAIAGIAGDQQAALFGQMCIEPGMIKNTYGTGCFMLMNTGTKAVPSKNNLLTTIAWQINGVTHYALEGSVFIAGAVVQWLRDGLQIIDSAPEVEGLANSVEDNGGVYMVPAFAGLGAPHWDQYARGMIIGITRGTTRGHFARAAVESIALQVSDLISAMEADSGIELAELRVDGGATANESLLQFQADLLQVPVVRPQILETTALGAAYLAGLAVGYWPGIDAISEQWKVDQKLEPGGDDTILSKIKKDWSRAVERAKNWEE